MSQSHPIRRALISVYDKTGIVDFARALHEEFGIEIISTGGTAKVLTGAGVPVTLVEQITGSGEMLGGRVKTLHPKVFAAILADRDNPEHMRQLQAAGVEPIDMVVVNLYPFEQTIADRDCTRERAVEMIDIGGVALLRAAAKNFKHVLAVCRPYEYDLTLALLRDWGVERTRDDALCSGAFGGFWETTSYDAAISTWLSWNEYDDLPDVRVLRLWNWGRVRYGENPHQRAELLSQYGVHSPFDLTTADQVGDQEETQQQISFNNYVDADAALGLCAELTRELNSRGRTVKEPRASARAVVHPQKIHDSDVFSEPTPGQPAWLLTWTTYGTSLPGDERGFASRRPDDSGGHVIRNEPGTRYDADQTDISESARQRMEGTPLRLTRAQAERVLGALIEAAESHEAAIMAVSIMSDQVHLLCQAERSGSQLLQLFKGVASRRLSQDLKRPGAPRWWTKSGSKKHFRKRDDLEQVVHYVTQQRGALVVRSFLDTACSKHGRARGTARTEVRGSPDGSRADHARDWAICCFIKHTNACGVGIASPDLPDDAGEAQIADAVRGACLEAYRRAYLGDPNAAMGGVLAVNFPVDAAFAQVVMETLRRFIKEPQASARAAHDDEKTRATLPAPQAFFVEVWVAPSFDEEAVRVIRGEQPGAPQKAWGKRVRLLEVGDMSARPDTSETDIRRIAGGVLMQTHDLSGLDEEQWRVVTRRAPSEREMADLRLAWLIAKHTKSNAISICRDGMLIGNGAGQMSRVMSCRIATWLARESGHTRGFDKRSGAARTEVRGSCAASDGFFPFRDGPEILIDAGVTAIIQPGGSKRDPDVIAACDERDAAMILTGTRHFRH